MDPTPAFAAHVAAVRQRLADSGMHRTTPDTVTWKINREAIVVAGWGRAILLQFSHPLIAAGVAEHSSFNSGIFSSFSRLFSTVRAMLSLTFGTDDEVIAAAAGINTIHDRVRGALPSAAGPFPAGTPYSAHQAELLQWVHATLLDSLPMTYERLVGPLSDAERTQYFEEAAIVEPLLGVPPGTLPRSPAALEAYIAQMLGSGRITITDTSRTLARSVLHPPLSGVLWPAFRPVRLLTIGLLPPALRDAYGFEWTAREERALGRWTSAIRALVRALPPALRHWPMARRAERRVTLAARRYTGAASPPASPARSGARYSIGARTDR